MSLWAGLRSLKTKITSNSSATSVCLRPRHFLIENSKTLSIGGPTANGDEIAHKVHHIPSKGRQWAIFLSWPADTEAARVATQKRTAKILGFARFLAGCSVPGIPRLWRPKPAEATVMLPWEGPNPRRGPRKSGVSEFGRQERTSQGGSAQSRPKGNDLSFQEVSAQLLY